MWCGTIIWHMLHRVSILARLLILTKNFKLHNLIWSLRCKKSFEVQLYDKKKSWVVSFRGECEERGGIAQGSCASGFGVCCICK